MKSLIFLVFIIIGCHCSNLGEDYDKKYKNNYKHMYKLPQDFDAEDYFRFFEYYRNRNDQKNQDLYHPCVFDDWSCIRKFLAANSNCKPQHGPIPDPLVIPYEKLFVSAGNMTFTNINNNVKGLKNAQITEFYVNPQTGNLVMSINIPNMTQTIPKLYVAYQRNAKEPIVLSDFAAVSYAITYTLILPRVPHLKLELAQVHADIHDGDPLVTVGAKAYTSSDPDVQAAYASFNANILSVLKEIYVFQARLIAGVFIQKTFCDFGVDVYRNYLNFVQTKGYTNVPGH